MPLRAGGGGGGGGGVCVCVLIVAPFKLHEVKKSSCENMGICQSGTEAQRPQHPPSTNNKPQSPNQCKTIKSTTSHEYPPKS